MIGYSEFFIGQVCTFFQPVCTLNQVVMRTQPLFELFNAVLCKFAGSHDVDQTTDTAAGKSNQRHYD